MPSGSGFLGPWMCPSPGMEPQPLPGLWAQRSEQEGGDRLPGLPGPSLLCGDPGHREPPASAAEPGPVLGEELRPV